MLKNKLKPFVKYPGGKTSELKFIKPYLPRSCNRYFEPFVGGGAVYFSFEEADQFYINDKSFQLINLYKNIKLENTTFYLILSEMNEDWKLITSYCKNNTKRFDINNSNLKFKIFNYYKVEGVYNNEVNKLFLRKQKYIEKQRKNNVTISESDMYKIFETTLKGAYYLTIRYLFNTEKEFNSLAAFYYFIREFCYSSMFRFNKKGEFNVPYGGMSYNSKNLDEKIRYIKSKKLTSKLNKTEIYNEDFFDFMNKFQLKNEDFIFLDPPYDTEFSTYDSNEFNSSDQERLSEYLLKITEAKWLLIIKDSELIRSLYPITHENIFYNDFNKNYSVSFKNRNNKNAKHLIITNYKLEE